MRESHERILNLQPVKFLFHYAAVAQATGMRYSSLLSLKVTTFSNRIIVDLKGCGKKQL
jgi:hypothetical protein